MAFQDLEMLGPNPIVCNGPPSWSGSLTLNQIGGTFLTCGGLMVRRVQITERLQKGLPLSRSTRTPASKIKF